MNKEKAMGFIHSVYKRTLYHGEVTYVIPVKGHDLHGKRMCYVSMPSDSEAGEFYLIPSTCKLGKHLGQRISLNSLPEKVLSKLEKEMMKMAD